MHCIGQTIKWWHSFFLTYSVHQVKEKDLWKDILASKTWTKLKINTKISACFGESHGALIAMHYSDCTMDRTKWHILCDHSQYVRRIFALKVCLNTLQKTNNKAIWTKSKESKKERKNNLQKAKGKNNREGRRGIEIRLFDEIFEYTTSCYSAWKIFCDFCCKLE